MISQQCSNFADGSTTTASTSPTSMFMSRLPTIPSTSEYPGDIGFEISFGPLTESASKSATWTYSDVCKKLYVNLASFCPIKFKTHMLPPPGTVLRAVAVFKGSTNLHDIVKRCPNHMESSNDGTNIFCQILFFLKTKQIKIAPQLTTLKKLIQHTDALPKCTTKFL